MGQKLSSSSNQSTINATFREDVDYPTPPIPKRRFNFGVSSRESSSSSPSTTYGVERKFPPPQQPAEPDVIRVPTVFRWKGGGKRVYLAGTFNGWQGRIPLARSGDNFMAIVDIPVGKHDFKFIVDGEWKYDRDQQTVTDPAGNINNSIEVTTKHPILETLNLEDLERTTSFGNYASLPEVFLEDKKNPPAMPPQLKLTMLNFNVALISNGERRSLFESPEISPLHSGSVSRSHSQTQSPNLSRSNSSETASEPGVLNQDFDLTVRVGGAKPSRASDIVQQPSDLESQIHERLSMNEAPGSPRKTSRAEDPAQTPTPFSANLDHVYFFEPSGSHRKGELVGVGVTFRYKAKFANVMLYKSLNPQSNEKESEILLALAASSAGTTPQ